jgi:hypothetical protein
MPAACCETSEQRVLGGLFRKMKWLGIKLARKRLDLALVDGMRSAGESLTDLKIVETKAVRQFVSGQHDKSPWHSVESLHPGTKLDPSKNVGIR